MTHPKPRGGLVIPSNAAKLVTLARNAGWGHSTGWGLEHGTGLPFYRVTLGRPASAGRTYVHSVITWHTNEDKGGLEINNKLVRTAPGGQWVEMPSLRVLSNMIHAEPMTGKPGPKAP
jgi:hypothetical protein